jgi:hypothetical protein
MSMIATDFAPAQPAFRGFEPVERGGCAPLDIVQAQAQGAPAPPRVPWAIENVTPVIQEAVAGEGPRS